MRMQRHSKRRGAAAIEFGLLFPIVILVLAAITDGALAMSTRQSLSRAARDAVRAGSRVLEPPGSQDGTEIEAAALDAATLSLSAAGVTDATTSTSWTYDDDSGLWWLRVDVQVGYRGVFNGLSPFTQDTRREFRMVTRQQPPPP